MITENLSLTHSKTLLSFTPLSLYFLFLRVSLNHEQALYFDQLCSNPANASLFNNGLLPLMADCLFLMQVVAVNYRRVGLKRDKV